MTNKVQDVRRRRRPEKTQGDAIEKDWCTWQLTSINGSISPGLTWIGAIKDMLYKLTDWLAEDIVTL